MAKKVTKKKVTKKKAPALTPEQKNIKLNYKKMYFMIDGNSLSELSRETAKKNAYIKAWIPDGLAEKLMGKIVKKGMDDKPKILGLRLEWYELK